MLVFYCRLLFGGEILRYGAIWLLAFLLVGLLEEYLTRGYLLYTLARALAGLYQWLFKTPHSGALGFWTSSPSSPSSSASATARIPANLPSGSYPQASLDSSSV